MLSAYAADCAGKAGFGEIDSPIRGLLCSGS